MPIERGALTITTGDLIAAKKLAIGDGYRAKNSELSTEGLPFARAGNINGGFQFSGADRFPAGDLGKVGDKVSQPGDVVFTSKGTVGRLAYVRPTTPRFVYSPQLCFWRSLDREKIDDRWLYYWMSAEEFRSQMLGVKGQTDMADYVSLSDQRRMQVTLPHISTQRRIAAVLGTLDNKIEQNRRTSRALEDFARATFKAWFVDFEPVKAKAAGADSFPGMPPAAFAALPDRLTDSPLGPAPQGWKVGKMSDIGEQRRDQIAPGEVDGETPYIGLEHIPRGDIALCEWGAAASVTSSKFRFHRGDILFGKLRPYFHKVGPAPLGGVCSTDIVVLYPKRPEYSAWLLMLVSSDDFVAHADRSSAGTKMPRTNWNDMAAFATTVPPSALGSAFQQRVGPILDLIAAGIHESRKLATLRDYLLPRLLSGRVRVRQPLGNLPE